MGRTRLRCVRGGAFWQGRLPPRSQKPRLVQLLMGRVWSTYKRGYVKSGQSHYGIHNDNMVSNIYILKIWNIAWVYARGGNSLIQLQRRSRAYTNSSLHMRINVSINTYGYNRYAQECAVRCHPARSCSPSSTLLVFSLGSLLT